MKKAEFTRDYFVDCSGVETEEGYHRFLDFAFQYADGFTLCVYRKEDMQDLDAFRNSVWGYLADSVYDYEDTNETPVTIGPEVIMLYFRFDDVTRKFLNERRNIYDFCDGYNFFNNLWDLAFLKDRKIFFISCTHEEFCSIDEDVLRKFQQAE